MTTVLLTLAAVWVASCIVAAVADEDARNHVLGVLLMPAAVLGGLTLAVLYARGRGGPRRVHDPASWWRTLDQPRITRVAWTKRTEIVVLRATSDELHNLARLRYATDGPTINRRPRTDTTPGGTDA